MALAPTLPLQWPEAEVSIAAQREIAQRQRTAFTELRLGRSVSIDQAGHLLNVSRRTVYNRIREGRLQTIRTLGGFESVEFNFELQQLILPPFF